MRSLFDQYLQTENRVTHALMTALNEDRRLLGRFLRELVKVKPPVRPSTLSVLEQQYPGESEPREEDLERRRIPDAWICDDDDWCVIVESKVVAKLDFDQIRRHRRTAERRQFKSITSVAIVPVPPSPSDFPGVTLLEWRRVYEWLRFHGPSSEWAARAAGYLEIAEEKLVENGTFKEGTLTKFSGFPFCRDHPFTYREGKHVLGLALEELRHRRDLRDVLGMNRAAKGRPAITGRQGDAVWDFLSLSPVRAETFTSHPHLTLGVTTKAVEAMVTVPNAVNGTMRRNLIKAGEAGFREVARKIVDNLKPTLRSPAGATPWFRAVQRRYPSQRSTPFVDARIDFDLRTAVPSNAPTKLQPRWLSAAYGSFVNKGGANYQMQMGVLFGYEHCSEQLRLASSVELIASAWLACKPLIDLAR